MKKKTTEHEDTVLKDDFDVFEEFEAGGEPPNEVEEIEVEGPHLESEEDIGLSAGADEEPPVAHEKPAAVPSKGAAADLADELMDVSPDIPVTLVAVIGKKTTTVADLLSYRMGKTIDLGRTPGETVDLIANGRLIARGELVEIDGKLGVRILKMVK